MSFHQLLDLFITHSLDFSSRNHIQSTVLVPFFLAQETRDDLGKTRSYQFHTSNDRQAGWYDLEIFLHDAHMYIVFAKEIPL